MLLPPPKKTNRNYAYMVVAVVVVALVAYTIHSFMGAYGVGIFWRKVEYDDDKSGLMYGDKFCQTTPARGAGIIEYFKYNTWDKNFYRFEVLPFIIPLSSKKIVDCKSKD